ncbi:DsbA family protein [Microbacterium betulae]|uniref:DsbA family protein n=1 Tax=Microbacterium betulae TaxID=2981139 RepID=A0AA97FG59_9MICO|nr:DsbA family protein [Microbacterium sp. AB]WOF22288.1 DsbA family protein [Microbacterium sp. AB]
MMASAGKKTNWFAIVISAVVVVAVVALGGLVVWMNGAATAPADAPAAGVVNEETGAIVVGDGPNVIEEYVDFMCPYCGQYWATYSEYVSERVSSGDVTLEIHPISILDNTSQGTQYSTRSASAAYCVAEADSDAFYPFVDLLYDNQPAESTEGLSDDELISYAEQAGAAGAASCIADGDYMDYVAQMTPETPIQTGASGISTPTVVVNGEFLSITWDPETDLAPLLTE